MMKTSLLRIGVGLVLAWLPILMQPYATPAQQATPAKQTPPTSTEPAQDTVRITTQLVQIDAIVTNKKGEHIENLSGEEFDLTVDGKPQPLTFFKQIRLVETKPEETAKPNDRKSLPALAQLPARPIEQENVRRTIALVVDDLGLSFKSILFAKDALRRFVAEQMQEGDLVTIVRTSGGFGIYQQFTNDKRILYASIEKLRFANYGRRQIPFTLSSTDSLMGRNEPFKTASEKSDETRQDTMEMAKDRVEKRLEEFRENYFSYGTLGSLNYVVRALRPLPGRKVAVILSDGLPVSISRDKDLTRTSALQQRLLGLVELANRSSVAFYSVNVEGLLAPFGDTAIEGMDDAMGDSFSGGNSFNDGLRTLAYDTGGLAFYNNNDTSGLLKKAVNDNRSYYLLGFDPEDETFDRKFHKIKVRVKRPGLQVRTRQGFFGVEDDKASELPKTREAQLLSAMFSPFAAKEIPYQVTSLFYSSIKGEPVIRSYFHIDCSKLKFKDEENGEKSLALELANFTFNEAGGIVESSARSFTLRFDEARYRQALAEGLTYLDDFPVKKSGAYQLRSALRDAGSGLLGSSSQFIQIPNLGKNKLTLSGIILNVVANGEAATPVNSTAPAADVLEAEVLANPAVRRFASNSEIEYQAVIHNPRLNKQTGQPSVKLQFELYRNGKPIFQSPERAVRGDHQKDSKSLIWLDCGGRFQLKNFSAGEYLLRLAVKDEMREGTDAVVEQWIDFTVK